MPLLTMMMIIKNIDYAMEPLRTALSQELSQFPLSCLIGLYVYHTMRDPMHPRVLMFFRALELF